MDVGPNLTASRWDAEYRQDRYTDEPPLPFVAEILQELHQRPPDGAGLYVGCGNGRNFVPLVDAGLDLHGLDVSREALKRLAARRPAVAGRLTCVDFRDYPATRLFAYLIAIQVFQHGPLSAGAAYFQKSAELLPSGARLFVRVNSVSTDIYHRHSVIERTASGGVTVRYEDGPKRGLAIHFFSRAELDEVSGQTFRPLVEPREVFVSRAAPKVGQWAQWEMIGQRR